MGGKEKTEARALIFPSPSSPYPTNSVFLHINPHPQLKLLPGSSDHSLSLSLQVLPLLPVPEYFLILCCFLSLCPHLINILFVNLLWITPWVYQSLIIYPLFQVSVAGASITMLPYPHPHPTTSPFSTHCPIHFFTPVLTWLFSFLFSFSALRHQIASLENTWHFALFFTYFPCAEVSQYDVCLR